MSQTFMWLLARGFLQVLPPFSIAYMFYLFGLSNIVEALLSPPMRILHSFHFIIHPFKCWYVKNEAQNLLASYNTYPSKIKAQIWFLTNLVKKNFNINKLSWKKKGFQIRDRLQISFLILSEFINFCDPEIKL